MSRRAHFFQTVNEHIAHQQRAGVASWAAFSARWRARQGLPLLSPLDVQYLTPQDFCSGSGHPLDPATQRRLFRHSVQAAIGISSSLPLVGRRRACVQSGDLAFIRAAGFGRSFQLRQDYCYGGRDDLLPYESESLLPTRPYGIPVTSPTFEAYWMQTAPDDEHDDLCDLLPSFEG
jgi:hypothetical protein